MFLSCSKISKVDLYLWYENPNFIMFHEKLLYYYKAIVVPVPCVYIFLCCISMIVLFLTWWLSAKKLVFRVFGKTNYCSSTMHLFFLCCICVICIFFLRSWLSAKKIVFRIFGKRLGFCGILSRINKFSLSCVFHDIRPVHSSDRGQGCYFVRVHRGTMLEE